MSDTSKNRFFDYVREPSLFVYDQLTSVTEEARTAALMSGAMADEFRVVLLWRLGGPYRARLE